MWLATARTLVEEETLHKLRKVPGCCISNPWFEFKRKLSGLSGSKGNVHETRMVNSEAVRSAVVQDPSPKGCCVTRVKVLLDLGAACSHCHTRTPSEPGANPGPKVPHAVRLVSLNQNHGNHSQIAQGGQAHENTHWQRPNLRQSLCKQLNGMGDA